MTIKRQSCIVRVLFGFLCRLIVEDILDKLVPFNRPPWWLSVSVVVRRSVGQPVRESVDQKYPGNIFGSTIQSVRGN